MKKIALMLAALCVLGANGAFANKPSSDDLVKTATTTVTTTTTAKPALKATAKVEPIKSMPTGNMSLLDVSVPLYFDEWEFTFKASKQKYTSKVIDSVIEPMPRSTYVLVNNVPHEVLTVEDENGKIRYMVGQAVK